MAPSAARESEKSFSGLRGAAIESLARRPAYIGRFAQPPTLTPVCDHAMLGVTLAPITGLLVAETLTGSKPSVDMTRLHPDRFA